MESAQLLLRFIKEAKYAYKVRFTQITPAINTELPTYLPSLHQSLANFGVHESVINLRSINLTREVSSTQGFSGFKFPYFDEITLRDTKDLSL
jgi:hypothetical protein